MHLTQFLSFQSFKSDLFSTFFLFLLNPTLRALCFRSTLTYFFIKVVSCCNDSSFTSRSFSRLVSSTDLSASSIIFLALSSALPIFWSATFMVSICCSNRYQNRNDKSCYYCNHSNHYRSTSLFSFHCTIFCIERLFQSSSYTILQQFNLTLNPLLCQEKTPCVSRPVRITYDTESTWFSAFLSYQLFFES